MNRTQPGWAIVLQYQRCSSWFSRRLSALLSSNSWGRNIPTQWAAWGLSAANREQFDFDFSGWLVAVRWWSWVDVSVCTTTTTKEEKIKNKLRHIESCEKFCFWWILLFLPWQIPSAVRDFRRFGSVRGEGLNCSDCWRYAVKENLEQVQCSEHSQVAVDTPRPTRGSLLQMSSEDSDGAIAAAGCDLFGSAVKVS